MHKGKKILIIIIAVIAVLAAVAGLLIYGKLSLINNVSLDETKVITADQHNSNAEAEAADPTPATDADQRQGVQMIALVGLDSREGEDNANSDTMIICCINHDEKTIKLASLYRDTYVNISGDGNYYTKANAAYAQGGPEQFLSMLNLNFDLNITQFATTRFKALADAIDVLGGLDIDMTRQELIHMNNYNVETSEVCGYEYEAVEVPDQSEFDGVMTRTFHLTGTQAVSYARIRYTDGYDYKRTERQRTVLMKMFEKVKNSDILTLNSLIDTVFPEITTNLTSSEILSLAKCVLSYNITDQTGFPFEHVGANIGIGDMVVPVTLESNAIELHEFLLPGVSYTPSETVKEYSAHIESDLAGGGSSNNYDSEDSEEDISESTPTPTAEATQTPTATEAPEPTADPVVTDAPEPTPDITEVPDDPEPTSEPEASDEDAA